MPPESWFWTHDGLPHQVNTVVTAGSRLIRLSAYGSGTSRRFAGLIYRDGGPERTYQMDLDAAAVRAALADGAHIADLATYVSEGLRYPTDLDAIRTPAGVRFTVTMRRERHWWNF